MQEVRVTPSGAFDNHARPYRHITARPLAAAMGAEIAGVDVRSLSDEAFAEVQDALWHHKMIYFRDQPLSHADHEAFSLRWGPFGTDAYTAGVADHPDVQPVIKEAETCTKAVFGGSWHTDSAFLPQPPSVSTLYSVEIPPYGGDTAWANTVLAYRMLSPAMQAMLAPLRIHMSAQVNFDTQARLVGAAIPFASDAKKDQAFSGSYHPLVRTHPHSGEKALYVDESYAIGIEGMTSAEARPLLAFLAAHITQHAFTCRLRWEPKMLVLWDNRISLHHASNDYDGHRRELYRTTVQGETPA
ncbi:MAG TPA: TauD/TfdA family dioxygenase [Sphingobium sp.]|nr:TauD/TfdA family dioxygenase [Sphingobium sp.]